MDHDETLAELFEQYKDEVRETIVKLDSELVAIEQDPSSSEVIFSIFRHLHSLKGSSKMFNVDNLGHLAHKLEDLMQKIDQDNAILSRFPGIVELLFQGNDHFREIIARLEEDIGFIHLTPEHAQFIEAINQQLSRIESKDGGLITAARALLDEIESLLPALEEQDTEALHRVMNETAAQIQRMEPGGRAADIRYSYGRVDVTDYVHSFEDGLDLLKSGQYAPQDLDAFFSNAEAMSRALFDQAGEDIMGVLGELNDGLEMYKERRLDIDPIVTEFLTMVLEDLKNAFQTETISTGPETAEKETPEKKKDGASGRAAPGGQAKTIRVDEKKIDLFLESVGKLITQSEILNHLQFAFREAGINPSLVRDFAGVNRTISNDIVMLQKSIMEVRQVEMDNILKKFPRLVRDLSHKMGKEAALEIEGERVPIDKSLLDDVEQAMIHLIRNAIDHGLEPPAEREARGKHRRGSIRIRVIQEEASILVELGDDGRGIDPVQVQARALDRGMITREQADVLSEQDTLLLVFHSGLTTKAQATDISGRGVGLDVVLSNIRKWNGEVDLDNRAGQGLTIRLRIPITNTLLTKEAILLKMGGSLFCLPLEYVVEIVTVPTTGFHRHKDQLMFQHRNQVITVVNLQERLGLDWVDGAGAGRTCLLLRGKTDNRRAIAADQIVGQQKIVLKDFDLASFRRLPYFQGLTLLGDGRVVLVLNGEKIVE